MICVILDLQTKFFILARTKPDLIEHQYFFLLASEISRRNIQGPAGRLQPRITGRRETRCALGERSMELQAPVYWTQAVAYHSEKLPRHPSEDPHSLQRARN